MPKIILVDSLYINSGGGLRLLEYLVQELLYRKVNFHLLADSRCKGLFGYVPSLEYVVASIKKRREWYKQHDFSQYSSVLCFGNIPTPVKLDVPVFTYYHNINLLTLHGLPSWKEVVKGWMKREVYRHYKENTNYWLVQTENTKEELMRHLKEKESRILLMPFYNIPASLCEISYKKHGDDYVYVSKYTGSKQHEELLEAWCILNERGINKTLHLTVQDEAKAYLEKIKKVQRHGIKIVNHGFMPFEDVIKLYSLSKAIVYPSVNESLGLGLVEAITAGCDVIGADLSYTKSVCKPSVVFNPYSAESIAEAVMAYETGKMEKSELLIHNHISELINLLKENN